MTEALIAEIQTVLCIALKSMMDEEATHVAEHLVNVLGCGSVDDLKYLQEGDLPMLKPMQIRRLMSLCQAKSGGEVQYCIFLLLFRATPHFISFSFASF